MMLIKKKVFLVASSFTKKIFLFFGSIYSDVLNEVSRDYLIKHQVFSTCDVGKKEISVLTTTFKSIRMER